MAAGGVLDAARQGGRTSRGPDHLSGAAAASRPAEDGAQSAADRRGGPGRAARDRGRPDDRDVHRPAFRAEGEDRRERGCGGGGGEGCARGRAAGVRDGSAAGGAGPRRRSGQGRGVPGCEFGGGCAARGGLPRERAASAAEPGDAGGCADAVSRGEAVAGPVPGDRADGWRQGVRRGAAAERQEVPAAPGRRQALDVQARRAADRYRPCLDRGGGGAVHAGRELRRAGGRRRERRFRRRPRVPHHGPAAGGGDAGDGADRLGAIRSSNGARRSCNCGSASRRTGR